MDDELTLVVTDTALGWVGVALSPAGVRLATLFHHTREAAVRQLEAAGARERPDPRAEEVVRLLKGYAAGTASLDTFPVDPPAATDFQRRTWLALRDIPRGETRSYGWLANHVGAPGKARVVGSFNGANPVPLFLPCHRVIGANGDLVGFGGGLAMKRQLLELEGALPKSLF